MNLNKNKNKKKNKKWARKIIIFYKIKDRY